MATNTTKMVVSLDPDTKRVIQKLTKALEKVAANMRPYTVDSGLTDETRRRLQEPSDPEPC